MCNTNGMIDVLILAAACDAWLEANPAPDEALWRKEQWSSQERRELETYPYRVALIAKQMAALARAAKDSGVSRIQVTADDFWHVAKFWTPEKG